jgi:hypothetical protein
VPIEPLQTSCAFVVPGSVMKKAALKSGHPGKFIDYIKEILFLSDTLT